MTKAARIGLGLGLTVLFAFGAWLTWDFVIDDAFITFRYSEHLAEGLGPVWNVGGDAVEGFTNFAWMLWHALWSALGADLVLVAKVTSLVLGAITLVMLLRATEGAGSVVAGLAFVLFLPTYFHANSGLETVAFAAVLLRLVIVAVRVIDEERVFDWEPPLLLLFLGMLRPEGLLAALPAFAVWFWYSRRMPVARWTTVIAAAVGAGYFVWRWFYYGQLLPNTFYVKFGNLEAGAEWVVTTAILLAPLLLLSLALLVVAGLWFKGGLFCLTVVATWLPYALSGPTMDYLHRFAYHVFPVLCLGAGIAVAAIGQRLAATAVGAITVGWVAVAGATAPDLPLIANYGSDLQRAHVAIGRGLAEADVPEDARTLAVSDAGAIPYYSDWQSIDYIGLNDEAIAHGADPTEVVMDARPTVLMVTSYQPGIPDRKYGLNVPVAIAGYEQVGEVRMREEYWQNVYVLPQYAPQVRAALAPKVEEAQRTHDPGRYDLTVDRWLDRLTGR
ncbi:hypothetical protein [Prauserella cavernicola]|uniref:Glycosyltransferase RgtA/B/C/D-like domain-containing protein n=1 Tax=Prauserella cavernicola TaxID=2800127 RepID=A0A934V3H5_9PSEU|nr:hypothetical protein [Prauserella cavernicola]MBK1784347.1 hypothetical protein [Prauserella cavernicola]